MEEVSMIIGDNQLENEEERNEQGGSPINRMHRELYELIDDDDWRAIITIIMTSWSPMVIIGVIMKAPKDMMKEPLLHILLQYDYDYDDDSSKNKYNDYDDKQIEFLVDLLINEVIPEMKNEDLEAKNADGDTALHIAAARGNIRIAMAMLDKNIKLLNMTNSDGEIPLLKAALNGKRKMFWKLYSRGSRFRNRRSDGATALICSVLGNNFELALDIIVSRRKMGDFHVFARDQLGLTVLHHMVSMPESFRSGCQLNMLDSLLYECIPETPKLSREHSVKEVDDEDLSSPGIDIENQVDGSNTPASPGTSKMNEGDEEDLLPFLYDGHRAKSMGQNIYESNIRDDKKSKVCCGFLDPPAQWIRRQVYKLMLLTNCKKDLISQKKHHAHAMELLSAIAANRSYWQFLAWGNKPESSQWENRKSDKVVDRWTETPLTLAARFGLDEIVLKILQIRPTAALYCGKEGKNLLHVAVETRQVNIMKELIDGIGKVDPRLPLRLKSSKDDNGNTILHLAAMVSSESSSPVQMLEEFRWFERVKKILPRDLVNHRNKEGKTAQEVFTESHEEMVKDAKRQLTDTARACIGALVSAVTSAAGFSILTENGKKDEDTDKNTKDHPDSKVFLKVFSHTYMFGLSCTAMALLQFMALLLSSYKQKDFRISLPTQYVLSFATLFTAMFAMHVAFAINTYISLREELTNDWRNYIWIAIEVFTVPFICLLVLRYRSIGLPFLSTIRAYLH